MLEVCAIVILPSFAHAQSPHLTAPEVAQIANEALRIVVPADTTLTGMSVSTRGIAFNVRGSLAAFGAPMSGDTAVRFDRPVDLVSDSALRGCSQGTPLPCAALGSRVYVSIAPAGVTSSDAHVRVLVLWATRRPYAADSAQARLSYLGGFLATIHLVRNAVGAWAFKGRDPSGVVF